MTQSPFQHQPIPLDPITLGAMRCTTIDALPHHPQASVEEIASLRDAAFLVVAALGPRDPLQALLAARIVAAHYHVMDNFRCAAQRDLPPSLQLRYQGRAVAMSRLMDATLHCFLDRQTAAPLLVKMVPAVATVADVQAASDAAPAGAAPVAVDSLQHAGVPAGQAAAPAMPMATPMPAPTAAPMTTPVGVAGRAPAQRRPSHPDAATLEQLMAEVEARLATSGIALAA